MRILDLRYLNFYGFMKSKVNSLFEQQSSITEGLMAYEM